MSLSQSDHNIRLVEPDKVKAQNNSILLLLFEINQSIKNNTPVIINKKEANRFNPIAAVFMIRINKNVIMFNTTNTPTLNKPTRITRILYLLKTVK